MDEQQGDSWRDRLSSVVFLHHPKSGTPQVKCLPWQHLSSVDGCRKESPDTVTQPFLTVLVLSSGLVSLETPLHGSCSPSWTIMAQNQTCAFRSEGREGVSVLAQKSQAASCSWVSIHHMLTYFPSVSSFLSLCDWGSCFCNNMKTLFVSYWPSTFLLPQPPSVGAQCPITLHFLGEAVEEAGVTSSLWAVAAALLGCYL